MIEGLLRARRPVSTGASGSRFTGRAAFLRVTAAFAAEIAIAAVLHLLGSTFIRSSATHILKKRVAARRLR